MFNEINEILQIATATLLAVVCILLARHTQSGLHSWTGISFALSVLCYIIIESEQVQSLLWLRIVVMIGAICIPVQFWLLSRAIFDDHFKFTPSLIGWFFVQLIPHLNFFIYDSISWSGFKPLSSAIAGLTSLGFVLAGLYTAMRTKHSDLIDSRIRFRNIFITATAALIGMTLIVEAIPIDKTFVVVLQALQRSSILAITLYFILGNFGIRSGFFFREIPKTKTQSVNDPVLHARLKSLMDEQKIYRQEGLTIRELANLMNEQEYRLRRLINGQLGFRNFNDFLNQYRIREAGEILADPQQQRKTILEIAYELGYQSIGPFNKAFRDLKGTTPTLWRKSQMG